MTTILPLAVFATCLTGILLILHRYEHKFRYPIDEILVNLIGKNRAFSIPKEPVKAEHRKEPLYYKIEFSKIFETGFQLELSKLMAYSIKESGVNFDRMIGLESKKTKDDVIREKYSLVPILSAIIRKPYAIIVEVADPKQLLLEEGEIRKDENVIIIDDILTTGVSITKAAEYLHEKYKDTKVTDAFVFAMRYPYEEGGFQEARRKLLSYGIELHAIINNVNLVDRLYAKKYITLEQLAYVSKDKDLEGSPIIARLKNIE